MCTVSANCFAMYQYPNLTCIIPIITFLSCNNPILSCINHMIYSVIMISYVNPFRFIINQFIGFSVYHIVFSVVIVSCIHRFFLLLVIVSGIHRFVHMYAIIICLLLHVIHCPPSTIMSELSSNYFLIQNSVKNLWSIFF